MGELTMSNELHKLPECMDPASGLVWWVLSDGNGNIWDWCVSATLVPMMEEAFKAKYPRATYHIWRCSRAY